MAFKYRLARLEAKIEDPSIPTIQEMEYARERLLRVARKHLIMAIRDLRAGQPLLPYTPTTEEVADLNTCARWDSANGVYTEGARDEFRRRLAGIHQRRTAWTELNLGAE